MVRVLRVYHAGGDPAHRAREAALAVAGRRRRRRRRGHLVALGVLAQRADRARAVPLALRRASREPRPAARRPARPGPRERRSARHRLGARARQHGLDQPRDRRRARHRAVLVAAFVAWELRAATPMLPMRFFRNRASRWPTSPRSMFFGMFGSVFLLAQYFQTVQGYSPLESGLRILPWTAMPMLVAPIAGALSDRIGGAQLMGAGLALQAIGLAWIGVVIARPSPTRACPAVHRCGHRHGPVLRPRRQRRAVVRPPGRGGPGIGRQQRDPRARRRVRRRRTGLGLLAHGGYGSAQTFIDGLVPAVFIGAGVVALGSIAAFAIPEPQAARDREAGARGRAQAVAQA